MEDSRATRPGEVAKTKSKNPLASLREAIGNIEEDSTKGADAQQVVYDAIGELYAMMKGKGKGQVAWNTNTYGPWRGTKGKGKGKSDEEKECYNCGRNGHIARDCKSKGKGHESKEGEAKVKQKDMAKDGMT